MGDNEFFTWGNDRIPYEQYHHSHPLVTALYNQNLKIRYIVEKVGRELFIVVHTTDKQ